MSLIGHGYKRLYRLAQSADPDPGLRAAPGAAPVTASGEEPSFQVLLRSAKWDTLEMQKLALKQHAFHGEWNYELHPR